MEKLEDFRDFVKQQADFHLRMANKYQDNPKRNSLHVRTADMFRELYDFLNEMQSRRSHAKRLAVGWDEISDLPPELVSGCVPLKQVSARPSRSLSKSKLSAFCLSSRNVRQIRA